MRNAAIAQLAKTMVGMNMIVEGLAPAAFHNMRKQATCPLLRTLTRCAARRARHVASATFRSAEDDGRYAPGRSARQLLSSRLTRSRRWSTPWGG